jgi:hypothetical protein
MAFPVSQQSIGKPFRFVGAKGGILDQWDTVRKIQNGIVYGEFLICPVQDVRLKQDQPDHLKKSK